jgi:glutamine amidotransferase
MIAIINYGLGNLTSINNMCNKLGIDAVITSNEQEIVKADKLILPGVGHFNKGMENLKDSGLQQLLNDLVMQEKKPILGICLGAQLMTMHSEEGNIEGLKWIDATTIKFDSNSLNGLKIPHMGWSDIELKNENVLLNQLPIEPRFYHVHTYHFEFNDESLISATANYGYDFATAFHKNNIYGTQFHPEKSHKFGMKVFKNFAEL